MKEEKIMSVQEVAQLLQLTPSSVYTLAKRKKIVSFLNGRKRFIRESALEMFLRRNRKHSVKFYSKP
jgi:excisionase family DNA binding protein